jgi:hypothetical protein
LEFSVTIPRAKVARLEGGVSAPPDAFAVDDPVSFEEPLRADANTVRSRKWACDLFASHAALKSAVREMYGDRLKECFGLEADKILDQAFETIRALVDASGRDDSGSLRLRFHCAAWMAQQYKSRALLPKDADEEEKRRLRARLERQWGRTGWPPLHRMQCATGLSFFRRDVVPFNVNREREAAVFENEYTDLLLDVRHRALAYRPKHTVWRYEWAAQKALRAYVSREGFQHYAPDWRPELKEVPATAPAAGDDAEEDEPTVKIELIARRAATRAAKIAANRPPEEADACALLFLERVVEAWERETGRSFPLVPPVIRRADNEKKSDVTSRTSASAEVRDFPAKTEVLTLASQDKLSAVERLEFEPEDEPRGVSIVAAEAAVTACTSVGMKHALVVFVDDAKPFKESATFTDRVTLAQLQERLPSYLERNCLSNVESMTVRIRFRNDFRYLQIDDCTPEIMRTLAPFGFLQIETSPGNGQAWLALADELKEEQFEELKYRIFNGPVGKAGGNGGAHGSVRWPGSLNRKPKRRYPDGESPRVQLLCAALGRKVTIAELDAAGLLAPPRPKPSEREVREIKSRIPASGDWPDMNYYLSVKGNRSDAEMAWCIRALHMGHPRASVEAELSRIGEKARVRRQGNYVSETVEKAARWVGLSPRTMSNARPAESPRPPARDRGTL